jgi:hypothetical protein
MVGKAPSRPSDLDVFRPAIPGRRSTSPSDLSPVQDGSAPPTVWSTLNGGPVVKEKQMRQASASIKKGEIYREDLTRCEVAKPWNPGTC